MKGTRQTRIMENSMDIRSVILYLCMFGLSLVFMWNADCALFKTDGTLHKGQRRIIPIFSLMIGLLIPCLFAAYRDLSVGRDVSTYIIPNFDYGVIFKQGFFQYYKEMPVKTEVLFAFLLYICSKIKSYHLLFFIIQALILVPLASAIIKCKGRRKLVLGFAIYFFLFYNFSLSGMRQSIAMSLLVLGLSEYVEHHYKRTILLIVFAQLFHSSAILIVAAALACKLIITSKHKKAWTFVFSCGLLAVLVSFSLFGKYIAAIIEKISPLYAYYINKYLHKGFNIRDVYLADLLFKTLLVFIPLRIAYTKKTASVIDKMMLAFVLLGRYFVVFNGVFFEAMRIAFYFDLCIIIYLPRTQSMMKGINNRRFSGMIYIMVAAFYWLYFIMYVGAYDTSVYKFML